jgi:NAD(P)-dependent dehydrogenase (short-subunit alcohol dehydrogenase family)
MSASPLPAGIVLHDKVTFITCGNAGIGRAIAERFAEHGAQLVLFDRDEKVVETAEELRKDGRRARGVAGDVSHAPDVKQAVAVATAEFDRIDILVNNAGIGPLSHIESTTDEAWDLTMAINGPL